MELVRLRFASRGYGIVTVAENRVEESRQALLAARDAYLAHLLEHACDHVAAKPIRKAPGYGGPAHRPVRQAARAVEGPPPRRASPRPRPGLAAGCPWSSGSPPREVGRGVMRCFLDLAWLAPNRDPLSTNTLSRNGPFILRADGATRAAASPPDRPTTWPTSASWSSTTCPPSGCAGSARTPNASSGASTPQPAEPPFWGR